MVRVSVALGWLLALSACGAESRSVTPGATGGASPGVGGSAGNAAGRPPASTGGDAGAPVEQTEAIDDVEPGTQPSLVDEPAAFFWWGGLGNWFVCDRAEGGTSITDAEVADIVPPRGDSVRAFRVQGNGQVLGADLYAQLRHPDGTAVDLSAYAGIGFWARLDGASDQLAVGLSAEAPYCLAASDVTSVEVSVPNSWQKFELPFESFGTDGAAVANVEFIVGTGGGVFDLWLDDLSLLCRGECPTH